MTGLDRTARTARRSSLLARVAAVAVAIVTGCASEPSEPSWTWDLPPGFPTPRVPDDNPMNEAKVELGRHLFYDTQLSGNGTQACGSCHLPEKAFTDGLAVSVGSTDELTPRGAMGLFNVAYAPTLTWGNPVLGRLEDQAMVPMFGTDPVELGLADMEDELLTRLGDDPMYPSSFAEAFPADAAPISIGNIVRAIAAFERTLISGTAPYDRFFYGGEPDAMSPSALRGMELFFSERLECFHCHGGFNFADSIHSRSAFIESTFHVNGLYNVGGTGAYPTGNQGIYEVTLNEEDRGRFKAPTLRNITRTAPYMHDGSLKTLDEVLDFYAAGGRNVTQGPWAGDGRDHPHKSEFVGGFQLSEQERADVLAFLEALTDEPAMADPAYQNPFK